MAEVQTPDMTTTKKLPKLWLPILRLVAWYPIQSAGSANTATTRFMQIFFTQVFGNKGSIKIERETEKIMFARTSSILARLLMLGAALSSGIALVGAQNTTNPQLIPQTTVQAPAQSNSANPALPKKMKRTTNEERRAAAARHADRRAAQLRKHHGQVK